MSSIRHRPSANPEPLARCTEEALIARAREVATVIGGASDQIEAHRELPPAVLGAMHDAQLFRLTLPRALGGQAADQRVHGFAMPAGSGTDLLGDFSGC